VLRLVADGLDATFGVERGLLDAALGLGRLRRARGQLGARRRELVAGLREVAARVVEDLARLGKGPAGLGAKLALVLGRLERAALSGRRRGRLLGVTEPVRVSMVPHLQTQRAASCLRAIHRKREVMMPQAPGARLRARSSP
jgi:hypothetical protein